MYTIDLKVQRTYITQSKGGGNPLPQSRIRRLMATPFRREEFACPSSRQPSPSKWTG